MRRRVLLVQPSMQPPGGGNGVAAWMLQALAPDYDVTTLTWVPVAVDPINRFFGTSLVAGGFSTMVVPRGWKISVDSAPVPAALLRSSLLMRYAHRVTGGFDVIIGAHNEVDYGRRGIQYVHYPTYLRPRPAGDMRWYHSRLLLDGYYRLADRVAGFSVERMRRNLTLANSHWTSDLVSRSLGVPVSTVYPPVVAGAMPPAWSERRRGFIAMGRISLEKRYERVIRILARVKREVPDLTLTVVGTVDRGTRHYYTELQQLAARLDARHWISFRENLSRDEVRALIATHRYGIHGMDDEHFGMAPAEMARGGMLVWVPNSGGQREIVGEAPGLRYNGEDDAVAKIVGIIAEPAEEQRLREHLAAHTQQFSAERFVAAIRTIVDTFKE
jgi:glycosyltransferase involved in cell wall biosynthesis